MKLKLMTKRQNKYFNLRGIYKVYLDRPRNSCLDGVRFLEVYDKTHNRENVYVEIDIPFNAKAKAYYLCGVERTYYYNENVGIAFVPCEGQNIVIDNAIMRLDISDAREIKFLEGDTSDLQPAQIFARYINEGKPL